jgi:predicted lactoylglutathione lyase
VTTRPRAIFVNLPVLDLPRAHAFFTALGWRFNPQFGDDNAACLIIADTIYATLLTHGNFSRFTAKEIVDAHRASEVLLALSVDRRAEVDALVGAAIAAGGREPRAAADHGFMYVRAFEDPDGHIWEVVWMDPAAVQPAPNKARQQQQQQQ